MKRVLISSMLMISGITYAGVSFNEMSLNGPGYTDNLTVVQPDLMNESFKHKLSYDYGDIDLNNEVRSIKHLTDQMSWSDRAKVQLFVHDSMIEKQLAPKTVVGGRVSLRSIVQKSLHDTAGIEGEEDYQSFLRDAYTEKLNRMIPNQYVKKVGNRFHFKVTNHTDFKIKKIITNLKVSDSTNGRKIMDADVTEYAMNLKPGKTKRIILNMPSRLEGFANIQGGLNQDLTIKEVHFTDGTIFNADEFYKKIQSEKVELDQHPFTEI